MRQNAGDRPENLKRFSLRMIKNFMFVLHFCILWINLFFKIALGDLLDQSPIWASTFYPPCSKINFPKGYSDEMVEKFVEFCDTERIRDVGSIENELLDFAELHSMVKLIVMFLFSFLIIVYLIYLFRNICQRDINLNLSALLIP